MNDEVNEPKQFIRGAFVICKRVEQKHFTGTFQIKLSSINTIVSLDEDNES